MSGNQRKGTKGAAQPTPPQQTVNNGANTTAANHPTGSSGANTTTSGPHAGNNGMNATTPGSQPGNVGSNSNPANPPPGGLNSHGNQPGQVHRGNAGGLPGGGTSYEYSVDRYQKDLANNIHDRLGGFGLHGNRG